MRVRKSFKGALARTGDAIARTFSIAAHSEVSCSRASAESESRVVLPMPRGRSIDHMRNNAISSSGNMARRAYARASTLISARW